MTDPEIQRMRELAKDHPDLHPRPRRRSWRDSRLLFVILVAVLLASVLATAVYAPHRPARPAPTPCKVSPGRP